MITTRFGTEVEVVGADQDDHGAIWLKVLILRDGEKVKREYRIDECRADGGFSEIVDAIRALPPQDRRGVDL